MRNMKKPSAVNVMKPDAQLLMLGMKIDRLSDALKRQPGNVARRSELARLLLEHGELERALMPVRVDPAKGQRLLPVRWQDFDYARKHGLA